MDERDERARDPLDLRCEPIAPWLWRVSWRGEEPSQAEREELARVARSRESGALIVLDGAGGNSRRIPAALQPLTGPAAAALPLPSLPPIDEFGAVELFAPRGRGRCVRAGAAAPDAGGAIDVGRLVEVLEPKAATARALEQAERAIAGFASRDGWRPLPPRRDALDQGELLPAAASASSFDHEADGGELCIELAAGGAAARPIAGRIVRGREAFRLRLAAGRRPLAGRQLVLLRATAPADRGALLRVELDDEDLGPWRLGGAAADERVSFDLFRISSDLLAGRERVRLAFRVDGRPEVASLRWWFLTEEEPDGLWLTELEPGAKAASPANSANFASASGRGGEHFDRAADGSLLVHDDELFLRGVALAPGRELRYVVPRGERRLVMSVARAESAAEVAAGDKHAAGGAAELVVTAAQASTRLSIPAGSRARHEFTRAIGGGELVVRNDGAGGLLLLAPRLLR
jgi:hypothetical protein